MCLTIFHLRDLGIRIIGMFPFFIGPLLRPFPIQLGQILLRRRLNPARFCQLREKLRVTFSRVPPNDGSHRRVGLQGRSVHANRLPIDQSVFRQYLQHPRKHSAMGLQIDQSPRSRDRRMIRCALRQRESQKALQAQRVGAAPGNPSFRVNAFEISDHQHPEIHSRRDARPTHRFALVKTNALLFGELIKLFVLQNFIHPIVEDVPARSWQLSRRDPQWLLPRSFFTHRHRLSSPIATFFTDYGQCWSNYIEYSRLKSRLLPRAARTLGVLAFLHAFFVITLPRVYLGIHAPTDVIVGALMGSMIAYLFTRPRAREVINRLPIQWMHKHPGSFYACFFLLSWQVATLFQAIREILHSRSAITQLLYVGSSYFQQILRSMR